MEMHDNSEKIQRALLVGIDTGEYDAENSIDELYELVRSAGAEPVASVMQKREKPDGATCIGSGRLEEIKDFCSQNEIDFIVFDTELTPTQIRNIEAETDIRAKTNEGKLQVELAQLKYLMPRLSGKGKEMSRLGGGVGTRGPGETKLETDKRHIRRKIEYLKETSAEYVIDINDVHIAVDEINGNSLDLTSYINSRYIKTFKHYLCHFFFFFLFIHYWLSENNIIFRWIINT